MKVESIKYVLLVNDWSSSNYTTYYETCGIFDNKEDLKDVLLSILTNYFDEWCFDDNEGEEYLNECYEGLMKDCKFIDNDGEIAFKLEHAPYYK